MTVSQNKLKVQIETSINKGFDKLAGQLESLERSLRGISKLTGSFDRVANQLDISNKFRKNRDALEAQNKAQKKLNTDLQKTVKLYEDIGLTQKAAQTRVGAIKGTNQLAALQRGAALAKYLNKAKSSSDIGNLIGLIPNKGKENKSIISSLSDRYLKPALARENKLRSDAFGKSIGAVLKEISIAQSKLPKADATKSDPRIMAGLKKSFIGWDKFLTNYVAEQRVRNNVLANVTRISNRLKDPSYTSYAIQKNIIGSSGLSGTQGYLDKQSMYSKLLGKNAMFADGRTLNSVEADADKRVYDNRFRQQAKLLASRIHESTTNMYAKKWSNYFLDEFLKPNSSPKYNPYASPFASNTKFLKKYGYLQVENTQGAAPAAMGGTGPLSRLSSVIGGGIPNSRAQKSSLDFSQRLYKSYAKLGEVLFRIQYATLTIANLGGLVAFGTLSDSFMSIESSIGRVSSNAQEFNTAMAETRKIARDTYTSYESVAGIYSKIAFEANKYNLTQEQTLKLTRTIAVLSAAGGSNKAAQEQSIYQFQQSISSGKFGGDELRSVFEGAPLLARALAAGVQGTTLANADISKLRPDANGGVNVRTEDLLKGLQTELVQAEVQKLERTIRGTFGGAVANLVSSITVAAGKLNELTGASVAVNNFVNYFDDFIFLTKKDAETRQKAIMQSKNLDAEAIQSEIQKQQAYYNSILASRELVKQLFILASTMLVLKASAMAYNGLAAIGTKGINFSRGATISGSMTSTKGIGSVLPNILPVLGAVTMNFAKLALKLGGVATVITILYKVVQNLTKNTAFAGKEIQLFVGGLLLLADKIGEVLGNILGWIGKFVTGASDILTKSIKFFTEDLPTKNYNVLNSASSPQQADALLGRVGVESALRYGVQQALGKPNSIAAIASDRYEEFRSQFKSTKFGNFTGGGFGGTGTSPSSDISNTAREAANKFRTAVNSADKFIQDISDSVTALNNSSVFGNFFYDMQKQNNEDIRRLEEDFRDIGGVPARLRAALNAAIASRDSATLNKEIRDLENNLAIASRAVYLDRNGVSESFQSRDSSQFSILQNYLKYLEVPDQAKIVDMFSDISTTSSDVVSKFAELGLNTRLQTQLIAELNLETVKFGNELRKSTNELNIANNKSINDSIFDYNQQARGVFGRRAENERKIYDAEQSARDRLIGFLPNSDPSNYNKSLQEIADMLLEQTAPSLRSMSGSRSSTSSPTGGDVVTVIGTRQNEARNLVNSAFQSVEVVKQQVALQEELLKSPWIGAQRAISDYLESIRNVASQTETVISNAMSGLENMITDFVLTGKASLREFAQSVLADVTRMLVRQKITQPIAEFLGNNLFKGLNPQQQTQESVRGMVVNASVVNLNTDSLGSGLGGVLGGSNGIVAGDGQSGGILSSVMQMILGKPKTGGGGFLSTAFNFLKAFVLHTGGPVSSASTSRLVSPSMFVNAPRFHEGTYPTLAHNELPAILQRDEMVLTRRQQNAIRNRLNASSTSSSNVVFSPSLNLTYNASEGGNGQEDAENMGKILNKQLEAQFKSMMMKEMKQGGLLAGARR